MFDSDYIRALRILIRLLYAKRRPKAIEWGSNISWEKHYSIRWVVHSDLSSVAAVRHSHVAYSKTNDARIGVGYWMPMMMVSICIGRF